MTAKLDHALALAGRGLRVFPIQPNGKKPIIKNWNTLATTQPETINRWWSEHEDANIGLATGQGVVVLDYDMKPGQKGQQALDMHDMLGLPLDGYNVTTPTGGLHLYFRSGKPIRNSASKVAKNVDVRGDGGYVVAPGSTIDGKTYEATPGDLLDLPEWLAELATASKTETKVDAKTPLVDLDKPSNIEAAQAWARDEAPEAIEGSGGDETTYKVAARLRDFGLSQAECFSQLTTWNEFKAIPPWALEDLEQKVRNAYAYATLPIGINDAQGELGDVSSELSSLETETKTKDYNWLKPQEIPENFDLARIPQRQWLVPELLARQFVTGLISPGGVGKTQWGASLSIALPTGRSDICGFSISAPARVWVWNQEDDKDELHRRLAAAMRKFGVKATDLQGRLFINSGVDKPLMLAKRKADRTLVEASEVPEIIQFIKDNKIDVFAIDPLVEFHEGEENDNVQMRKIMAVARKIAVQGNCAVLVIAHTKKPPQAAGESYAGDVDALRGAGAQGNVMRMAYTLFSMSKKEAKGWGVREDEAHLYVRMDDAKANLFLKKDQPRWFKRVSVQLPNGETIGVLEPAKIDKAKASDVLEIVARTVGACLQRDRWYMFKEILAEMTETDRSAFGSKANEARALAPALASEGNQRDGTYTTCLTGAGVLKHHKGEATNAPHKFMLLPQPEGGQDDAKV